MIEFNQARADAPDQYLRGFGGDTSNMAIAAARLVGGAGRVGYVTRVGDDAFGRMLVDLWRAEGVDTGGVVADGQAPTGVYFVTHGAHGHEFSYLRAGSAASRMNVDTLPADVLRGATILHVSGISQAISATACDAVFAAIAIAEASGARISYDPNLRPKLWPLARARATIMATIAQCDWFLPSLDEAKTLSGQDDAGAIIDWCHALGAPVVALKRGRDGVVVSDGHRTRDHPRARRRLRRCDGRGRLLRWRVRRAFAGRRFAVRCRALCQRRRRAGHDRFRGGRAVAARCRRARAARRGMMS